MVTIVPLLCVVLSSVAGGCVTQNYESQTPGKARGEKRRTKFKSKFAESLQNIHTVSSCPVRGSREACEDRGESGVVDGEKFETDGGQESGNRAPVPGSRSLCNISRVETVLAINSFSSSSLPPGDLQGRLESLHTRLVQVESAYRRSERANTQLRALLQQVLQKTSGKKGRSGRERGEIYTNHLGTVIITVPYTHHQSQHRNIS